jgi:D-glycero-D-manno-heptose 1,7-bisphosphate phosphatase
MSHINAIFLDRDGVLIKAPLSKDRKPISIKNVEQITFINGIKKFCKTFKKKYLLIIITNQPKFIRKKNSKKNIESINNYIKNKLNIDDIFTCYSDDEKNINRKPNPGMLFEATKKHNINLKKSYFIGDRWRDVDAGNKSGCKTIFINRNYNEKLNTKPAFIVKKISEIYKCIK